FVDFLLRGEQSRHLITTILQIFDPLLLSGQHREFNGRRQHELVVVYKFSWGEVLGEGPYGLDDLERWEDDIPPANVPLQSAALEDVRRSERVFLHSDL